ncbi:MAG TPA: MBL fold metallo-hydrolase, partial [Vicinamibacterales bacterium]|jgi:glyoxylase-like metal-dependent hydrolase (beta-lactamase superfamily II)|nr:MBL fold metallo-hydrolase [Vicinamibacterales bacterium]
VPVARNAAATIAFNKPGLETQLPAYIQSLERRVAKAETATPPPADLSALKRRLEEDRFFLEQKRNVRHAAANVTFDDKLEIQLGGRRIQVLHDDRAVTPGDAFVYLPDEKILIAGDLLVNPISFALSCYPTGWLRTLERLDGLDASGIVAGSWRTVTRQRAAARDDGRVPRVVAARQGSEGTGTGSRRSESRDSSGASRFEDEDHA